MPTNIKDKVGDPLPPVPDAPPATAPGTMLPPPPAPKDKAAKPATE